MTAQENTAPVTDADKAVALAEQFNMDASDIAAAYKSKPESLTAHFNSMSNAKEKRGWYLGWTIFWGVVFAPVAAYPAWKLGSKTYALFNIDKSVRSEVEHYKATTRNNTGPTPPAF